MRYDPILIPSLVELHAFAKDVPKYMIPSTIPWAVVQEEAITDKECDHIIELCMKEEPYQFSDQKAITRELVHPLTWEFDPLIEFTKLANFEWFKFDLTDMPVAWMQSYYAGGSYRLHMDGCPGQSRKLTTVALLSDPADYDGGILTLVPFPLKYEMPRTRGTTITFPSWILHEVSEVTRGFRQSINLAYWGPPFR